MKNLRLILTLLISISAQAEISKTRAVDCVYKVEEYAKNDFPDVATNLSIRCPHGIDVFAKSETCDTEPKWKEKACGQSFNKRQRQLRTS